YWDGGLAPQSRIRAEIQILLSVGDKTAIIVWIPEGGPADPPRAAHLLLQSASLGYKWSVTVLDGPLKFLTPSTRIELKREFARRGDYSGAVDGVWDETAHAAATAYLDNPQ
ncbi:MAG TPA: hypothetical protein VIF39_06430, partial [Hyphomicrobium sp.]